MSHDDEEIDRLADEIAARLDDEDLESIAVERAFGLWMDQLDRAESTLQSYEYRINPFLEFCEERAVETLDELTPRQIKEFDVERRSAGLQRQTINNQFGTLKQFFRFCRDLDAISEEAVAALDVPDLSKDERVNTEKLIAERAHAILDDMERFEYASRNHVLVLLLWRTTIRLGAAHSLDLEDLYLDDADRERLRIFLAEDYSRGVVEQILAESRLPFIFPRHRPEQGTRLKNDLDGERVINISDWVADVLRDYIRVKRPDVTDEYGRAPLLSSRKGGGRLSKSAIRNWIYIATQPCEFGGPCPHDRDPETCNAREHGKGAECPSSRSPHKLRTGSITWHRDRGWPLSAISDKANAGEDLIEEVYDQPEKLTRGAARRHHLEKLDEGDP